MRVLTPTTLVMCAAMGVAGCKRAVPEDFPPSATASDRPASAVAAPSPSAETSLAGRCIRPLAAEPPPPAAPGPAPGCPTDPEPGLAPLETTRVTFPDTPGVSVEAEVARSDHDTTRGLMYRKSMAEDHGMLFVLRGREDHQFWMHNTCIPLDLIYIDEDGLIVGIVEDAPTLDDQPRSVGCPSRDVLEVDAGWARRHGVRPGQHVAAGVLQRP